MFDQFKLVYYQIHDEAAPKMQQKIRKKLKSIILTAFVDH